MLACGMHASQRPVQTNRLWDSCHSQAHSKETRASQGQLSASKSNDDVSPNRVILLCAERWGNNTSLFFCANLKRRQQWQEAGAEACTRRCEFCCAGSFDVLLMWRFKGKRRSFLTFNVNHIDVINLG